MDEYTFSDLIVNPEAPGLEDLIGKEVYFNDVPIYCIRMANKNYEVGILKSVRKDYSAPFFVKTPSGCMLNYACIVPKKEEPKPEYALFENAEEFLNAYHYNEIKNPNKTYHYLATRGIWLKDKSTEVGVYCMVTKVWDNGLVICDVKMSTDGTIEFNNIISWSELYESFTFLDGTPCGKVKEQKKKGFDIMDMKKLFEDFRKHVEQLDDDAIKQSISRAVEHSINSSSLEREAE